MGWGKGVRDKGGRSRGRWSVEKGETSMCSICLCVCRYVCKHVSVCVYVCLNVCVVCVRIYIYI